MIEQNVENEARPEAARRRGACHAERKNEPLVPGIGAALLCAGLGAAALWDLEIDLALYSPGFLPAVLMEAFGWFLSICPPSCCASVLPWTVREACRCAPPGGLLAVAGSGILLYMGAHHLVKRGMSGPSITLWTVLLGGLSLGICALALYRSRSGGRKKLEFVCLWGTVYLLAGLPPSTLSRLSGSARALTTWLTAAGGGFEGAFAQFTSWMQPFGNGGSSFPSGHTGCRVQCVHPDTGL